MVIKQNLSLLRILRTTWKVDLIIIFICSATYYVYEFLIPHVLHLPPMLPTLLGTALAFFVGFNNNQAYDRWWEARIIWGALVNDCRTWARNIIHFTSAGNLSQAELESIRRKMVLTQIGFVYALKESLRRRPTGNYEKFLAEEDRDKVRQENNRANAVLTVNAIELQKLSKANVIDEFRFMQMNELITAFTDHMGKSERIRNTVFPTSYIYFTRLFIWALVILITIILTDSVGAWSILVGWTIGFVFHITHQNGMGLMDPFDEISTGIPLDQISRTIEINLLQMLGDKEVPPQVEVINDEYIM